MSPQPKSQASEKQVLADTANPKQHFRVKLEPEILSDSTQIRDIDIEFTPLADVSHEDRELKRHAEETMRTIKSIYQLRVENRRARPRQPPLKTPPSTDGSAGTVPLTQAHRAQAHNTAIIDPPNFRQRMWSNLLGRPAETVSERELVTEAHGYLMRVCGAAMSGLKLGHHALGLDELAAIKAEIVQFEAPRRKNRHVSQLLFWSLLSGTTGLLMASVVATWFPGILKFFLVTSNPIHLQNLGFTWLGSQVGVWIWFCANNRRLSFEQLAHPDQEFIRPMFRLTYAGILSIVFFCLIGTRLTNIAVGDLNLVMSLTSAPFAFLLGFATSWAETRIVGEIERIGKEKPAAA